MKQFIFSSILILFSGVLFGQKTEEVFPLWKEGEMEIHHIYTGRGECVFCILPDGTTLLIDAGDSGPFIDPRSTHGSPNETKQAGEWIARYISNRMDFKNEKKIDYTLLTHFHGDHLGGVYQDSPKTSQGGDYYLSGLSQVYEYIPFAKMIDRDWPTYQYPIPQTGRGFENYRSFTEWNHRNGNMKMERFVPGTKSQFILVNNPEKYKDNFGIRNIVSSGEVWTGEGNKTNKLFPEVLPQGQSIEENKCSAGIRISYGDFDYFNGGDLSGRLPMNTESWKDIETPVGKSVGPVEVCEANHHAWVDAMNEPFLNSVKAQVIVLQVGHITHLNLTTLRSMTNISLNPNLKHIIPTNIPELSKAYLGDEQIKKYTGDGGHVVVKVAPGGKEYSIFLLTTEDESFRIKSSYGPYNCIKSN